MIHWQARQFSHSLRETLRSPQLQHSICSIVDIKDKMKVPNIYATSYHKAAMISTTTL